MKGTVCVVTGASGHVGQAVTSGLVQAGATVFGVLSSRHQQEAPSGNGWIPVMADVTEAGSVRALFDTAERQAGAVHVVVHTVGGFASSGPVPQSSVSDWDRMMSVNLRSAFLITREALRRLEGASYGRIILFGAMSGIDIPSGRVAYGISKAGVHLLAQTAARENRGSGVTINVIAPGIIDTPDNRESMPDADRTNWITPKQIVNTIFGLCDKNNNSSGTIIQMTGGT